MRLRFFWLIVLLGCAPRVYSPPSGTFPLESSATLKAEQQRVSGDVFTGGALFGPDINSLRGSYAHGLGQGLELSAAPTLIQIAGHDPGDSHPLIYAVRGGLKYAPARHFAASFGAGTGASAGGAFISPDVGVHGAFENRYLIPFANARGLLSSPLSPRPARFTIHDDAGDNPQDPGNQPLTYRRKPLFTYGVQLALGLKLPIHVYVEGNKRESSTKPALLCALGLTTLFNARDGRQTYGGLACGFEVAF